MGFKRFLRAFAFGLIPSLYCGLVNGQAPDAAKQQLADSKQVIERNPINDYLRSAEKHTLALSEVVALNQDTRAVAYAIDPPAADNALWSIRYALAENAAAAVNLRLVTVTFDENQRVTDFDVLMERNGFGEIVIEQLLWPNKLVYLLLSANPPSKATLKIEPIEKRWSMLSSAGSSYSDEVSLLSSEPVSKNFDFEWKAAATQDAQPLWDLSLLSEPGTQYGVYLRSGSQTMAVSGAKNEPLNFQNMVAGQSGLRLSIRPSGKRFSRVAVLFDQQPSTGENHERELGGPQVLSFDTTVTGTISHRSGTGVLKPEIDSWLVNVPEPSPDIVAKPIQIQITADNPANSIKLSVYEKGRNSALASKTANGEVATGPLLLKAGEYRLDVSSGSVGLSYRAKVGWATELRANSEKEPNNSAADANAIVSRKVVKGELSDAQDEDFFSLDTSADGAAQYWRLIATGGGVRRMALGSKYWIDAHKADKNAALSMDYMLLLPGVHTIKLTGEGRYTFRAIPLGPPKPGFEIEPNDGRLGPSERLVPGEKVRGSLDKAVVAGKSDIDRFRFTVNQRKKHRLTIVSPQDEAIRVNLLLNDSAWFSSNQTLPAGSTAQYNSELLEGEYVVELTNLANRRALDEYSVLIEELGPSADVGSEPNDIVGLGSPVVQSGSISASLGPFDQTDCYRLPPTKVSSSVALRSEHKLSLKFFNRYSASLQKLASRDPENASKWLLGAHDTPLYFCVAGARQLTASSAYTLDVKMGAIQPEPKPQLSVATLPPALQGGLNIAWYGLGARWESLKDNVSESKAAATLKKLNRVINNVSPFGTGFEWDAAKNTAAEYRLRLAGDEAVPLAGIVVNTRTNRYAPRKTRQFRLMVSQDGTNFTQAMLGELSFSNDDQYLTFKQPVSARYVKFLPLDAFHSRPPHYARLQELKVIAKPGYSSAVAGVDLASTQVGGHVVRHDFKPAPKNNADALDAAIIDPQDAGVTGGERLCEFPPKKNQAEWVVGFHHNRAAQIAQLDYTPGSARGKAPEFSAVTVSVSSQSPLGPWREIASWGLQELSAAAPLTIAMPDTPWVRFVRFVATGKAKTAHRCPHDIAVREVSTSNSYQSILGEWSEYGAAGPLELVSPAAQAVYSVKGGSSTESAKAIAQNQVIASSVKRERNEDWFSYSAESQGVESNSLRISIGHPNSFKPIVNLRNSEGELLQPLVESAQEFPEPESSNSAFENLPRGWTSTLYTVWFEGADDFSIHVQEPPRNVVLTWDASGSMGPQLPYIEMASRRWADFLKPDHEYAKVMKFAKKSYPENEWANLPHMLQAAMHSIAQTSGGSSDAENSLLDASELLAPRYGSHAIVVTTDGEYPRSKAFWESQNQHCSTIYAAGLAAAAVGEDFVLQSVYQDNFQNWVSACGGHYRYCDSVSCLEDFYAFAASDIRREKPYTLKAEEAQRAKPKPGLLKVVANAASVKVTANALYVILDASGSMLQSLDGKRRIAIAKETLKKVARESVGTQNHFGMRTFGLEVDECRHAVTLPLAKHSASTIDAAIDGVVAVNKAKTPIAASLEAAAADLSAYPGEKVIVLLTDGEETCDGDSAAILTSLRARDIDVKMHIVGFALDDKALVAQFKTWATLGGGQYYDASNQSMLQTALHNAVTPKYEVKNSVGDIVHSGHVGDPQHPLPAGEYTVLLPGYPELRPVVVEVASDVEHVVEFE
ncbi:MAG: VWA domain-containing protein [Halioglobus sp.]